MSEVARHYCGQPVLAHGTDAVYGICEEGVEFALADYIAARVASAAAENAELRSRIDEVRALIPECYMFRSSSMSPVCTDFIGGKIADGPGVFTEDMCCLPCRLRVVLAPAHDEGSEQR